MSAETAQHLNLNTLIGFTEKRGTAWHYREELQGDENNHYVGAIPIEDVRRRLFGWDLVEGPMQSQFFDIDGVTTITDPTRKTIIRPGNKNLGTEPVILGTFKSGYKIHQYREWLLDNVANLLDDNLQIASAGLLRNGAQAWTQIELPETVEVDGFGFRPFLTAFTSCDGSLATGYGTGAQAVVCDNTLSAAVSSFSTKVKIRHTSGSMKRINDVRSTLAVLTSIAEDMTDYITELQQLEVSDLAWAKFLDEISPVNSQASKRSVTMAEGKRDKLTQLWNHDQRVNPWKNTGLGVLQAVNTYTHHVQTVRNASRADRNMATMVEGGFDKLDASTLTSLTKVLATV